MLKKTIVKWASTGYVIMGIGTTCYSIWQSNQISNNDSHSIYKIQKSVSQSVIAGLVWPMYWPMYCLFTKGKF